MPDKPATALLQLGSFQFSISTAAYDELERVTSYKWAAIDIVGEAPQLQFIGLEAETITLHGSIFPTSPVAGHPLMQIPYLRAMAAGGKPFRLVGYAIRLAAFGFSMSTGTGRNLGRWVIERISEKESNHFSDGVPRRIDFDLSLKRYGN